jgi:hypothetical protein
VAVVSAVVVWPACSCVPSQSSCDGRPHGHPRCDDLLTNRSNQFANVLETYCKGDDGVFSTSLCNHTGALGGCLCEGCENGRAVTWLFADADAGINTTADVMSICGDGGQTFQSP